MVVVRPPTGCSDMRVGFRCRNWCNCSWRALLDTAGIYSLSQPVTGPREIFDSLRFWISSPDILRRLQELRCDDGKLLISVIERMYLNPDLVGIFTGEEVSICQRWVRKIAKRVGVLPISFELDGVYKTNENAVSGGGFADIYLGRHLERTVAIKVIRTSTTTEETERVHKEVCHEALLWKHLDHQHILPFLGVTKTVFAPRLGLVSPWMANGNILQYLERNPQADRLSLIFQSAFGLQYLHGLQPALLHGDVKAANILIDGGGCARLADFGLLTISETQGFATTFRPSEGGSVRWMAPELFREGIMKSRSSDIYSFGMTLLEVYTGRPPFSSGRVSFHNDAQILMVILSGKRPERPETRALTDDLWELIQQCWNEDPLVRPTSLEIANHLGWAVRLRS